MNVWRAIACLCVMLSAAIARGQNAIGPAPAGALAWWTVDPVGEEEAPGDAARDLVERVLRGTLHGQLTRGDGMEPIAELLLASSLSSAPHRLVVINIAMQDEDDPTLTGFEGVLEVGIGDGQADWMEALIPVADEVPHEGSRRRVALAGGREARSFRRAAWPEWLEVAWVVEANTLYLGIGRDALVHWFEAERGEGASAAHRALVEEHRTGPRVVEAFVDLNALRREVPAWFGPARAHRLLAAWNLSNARLLMLHGHLAEVADTGDGARPALLVVDATWEVRSESPGHIHHRAVTADEWPGRPAPVVAIDTPAFAAPLRLLAWIDRGVRTYGAMADDASSKAFMDSARRWGRAWQSRIARLQQAAGSFAVVGTGLPASERAAMPATLMLDFDGGVTRQAIERELSSVMESLGETVMFDEQTRTWSVRLAPRAADPQGVLGTLTWGLAGSSRPVFVVGWGPDAVASARAALEAP